MQPQPMEIEEVCNAFLSLASQNYTSEQLVFINRFLRFNALDYNENEIHQTFVNNVRVIDNLKTLHHFAPHYQNETDIYQEFQDQIEDLIMEINGNDAGLSVS